MKTCLVSVILLLVLLTGCRTASGKFTLFGIGEASVANGKAGPPPNAMLPIDGTGSVTFSYTTNPPAPATAPAPVPAPAPDTGD